MNDQQLAHLAVLTALNRMMLGKYFDLTVIDSAMKVLQTVPDGGAYAILRTLHCIHWEHLPPELRAEVPRLIERCIGVPAHQFQITPTKALEVLK